MALKDHFRIEKGEHGWVIWLSVVVFVLTVGSVMLARLLESFVIKRIGVEFLPWLHIIGAVVALFGSWITLKVMRGWRVLGQSMLFGILAMGGAFILALTQGFFTADKSPFFNFIFIIIGVLIGTLAIATAVTKMRNTVTNVFTYEQLSRLESIVSSMATLGVLAGGLLLAGLSSRIGLGGMYYLVAFILALSIPGFFILQQMVKRAAIERVVTPPVKKKSSWTNSFSLKEDITEPKLRRFIYLLGLIIGLSVIFTRIFTYSFDIVANDRFPTEAELNAFFGTFTVVLSLGALIFINFIQHLLFKKYGLTNNLYTPPIVVLVGVLTMFFYPLFWIVILVVYVREIIIGIQDSAYNSMLEGVSDYHRGRAWSWIGGPVTAVFDFVGSALLLGIGYLFLPQGTAVTISVLAASAVVFLLIRFLLTIRFKKLYPVILLESLKKGDFKTRLRAIEAMAEMRYMKDRHLGEVLDIIRDEEEPMAVRITALKAAGKIQDHSVLRVVSRFVDHPDAELRKQTLRTIAAFDYQEEQLYESGFSRHTLIKQLREAFTKEKDPETVNTIVDALIALRDPEVVPFLIEELHNESPEIRHSVLHSLRHFNDPAIIDYVKPFLEDPVAHVRAQAIAAIWQFPWERSAYLLKAIDVLLKKGVETEDYRQALYLIGALKLRRYRKHLLDALAAENKENRLTAAIAFSKLGEMRGSGILKETIRSGSAEEAARVTRLADHPDVPERQQNLIEAYTHQFHLHYPPDLPVSEPLEVRMRDIPEGCLQGLMAYYAGRESATERKKIDRALKEEKFPKTKGRVVLVGLPDPWREMAAIALMANGYLVREATVGDDFDETAIIVADIESEKFPDKTVLLTEKVGASQDLRVAKSHYAPSELLTEIKKLS